MLEKLFGPSKRQILVADDDPTIRSLLADVLDTQGYEVTVAGDGQEAVSLFGKKKFDLIILDVHMPRLTGIQVLEIIRVAPSGKDVGVIMLTSDPMTEPWAQAHGLGVVAYMAKPFPAAKLIETVRGHFEQKKPPLP